MAQAENSYKKGPSADVMYANTRSNEATKESKDNIKRKSSNLEHKRSSSTDAAIEDLARTIAACEAIMEEPEMGGAGCKTSASRKRKFPDSKTSKSRTKGNGLKDTWKKHRKM